MERTAHRVTRVAVVIFRRPYCVHTTGVKFLPGHSLSSERCVFVLEEPRNGTLVRLALHLDSRKAGLLLARAVVDDAGRVALAAHILSCCRWRLLCRGGFCVHRLHITRDNDIYIKIDNRTSKQVVEIENMLKENVNEIIKTINKYLIQIIYLTNLISLN